MQPHQQRVIDERAELEERIGRLVKFNGGPTFTKLPAAEQERMVRQLSCMTELSAILAERIAAFPVEPDHAARP